MKLETVTGVLVWYSAGVPAGRSFVSSLFRCKKRTGQSSKVYLSKEAVDDLMWWRALMVVAHSDPNLIAASISSVRRNREASLFLTTDACKIVGGGGFLSDSYDGVAITMPDNMFRWTREEISCFIEMNVSINVLEYYTAVYFIMLWVEVCEGKVIHVKCDNTSAVSWLTKSRSKIPAADTLAKIFSLFCLTHNISVISTHFRGVYNGVADKFSRDIDLCNQEADEEVAHGDLLPSCTRKELCRRLLSKCVTRPSKVHGEEILQILTLLRRTRSNGI